MVLHFVFQLFGFMSEEELIKTVNINKICEEGTKIYDSIKSRYLTDHIGEFLAIDINSQEVFLGVDTSEAVLSARKAHPGKVFFVVKIGYSAAERMVHLRNNRT